MMRIEAITTQNIDTCRHLKDDVIMVMPCTDVPMGRRAATLMSQRAGAPGCVLIVEDLDGWGFIRIANSVFNRTSGKYFGYVAQDAFAGRQWLVLALQALQREGKKLFAFNDGKWHGALASFGLVERNWAKSNYPNSKIFHDGYQRHYADVELSILAMNQGAYVYDLRSVIVELDWEKDQSSVEHGDRVLYKKRVADGFDCKVNSVELLALVS